MTEDIKEIAKYHGTYEQMSVLQEECAELIHAVSKLLRAKRNGDVGTNDAIMVRITEEIADIEIMIDQAVFLTGISREDIDSMKKYKIAREIGRIRHDSQRSN